jgi:hypothetical protein
LLDQLLEPLELEWAEGRREPDAMTRIKRLRTAIVPDIIHGELTEPEIARRWRQLADLYLAQQLHCYSGEYLAEAPTPERLLETAERYEEDLTDSSRAHAPIHAVISVGTAIEAAPTRDRTAGIDPLASELRDQLEMMLDKSKARRRTQT